MTEDKIYDCIIVGGGLAGLSLSILLARQNRQVLLIEKKSFPYHKVCGEYISNESRDFLIRLGIPLNEMNLPSIGKLTLSSVEGITVDQKLDLGGFGMSRYLLDSSLAAIAKASGVLLMENTNALKFEKTDAQYSILTSNGKFRSKILCASFGKYAFGNFYKSKRTSENWVGVKYHIQHQFPDDLIALHNFDGGYCGISKIEENTCCLCYLVKANKLKEFDNSIETFEKKVMHLNPYLKEIFNKAIFIFDKRLSISNVTFSVKKPVFEDVFYLGDSAGAIAPLSGNGMSNALRASNILADCLNNYFNGEDNFIDLKRTYESKWNLAFKKRITKGRWIQHLFCKKYLTTLFILIVKYFKPLRLMIIKQTHGDPF